jgi:hypothetical protein
MKSIKILFLFALVAVTFACKTKQSSDHITILGLSDIHLPNQEYSTARGFFSWLTKKAYIINKKGDSLKRIPQVELRGVEPLSKHNRQKLSTCLFRH